MPSNTCKCKSGESDSTLTSIENVSEKMCKCKTSDHHLMATSNFNIISDFGVESLSSEGSGCGCGGSCGCSN